MEKVILLIMYLIVLILIPLFLDVMMSHTIRRGRINKLYEQAKDVARTKTLPLIIFYFPDKGIIDDSYSWDGSVSLFDGSIEEVTATLKDNSAVVLVYNTMELVDDPAKVLRNLKRVAGDNLFIYFDEAKSLRPFINYKARHFFETVVWTEGSADITFRGPTQNELKVQKFYEKIFMVVPYKLIIPEYIVNN